MQSLTLSREARKVRIPAAERVKLACKRQGEGYWCIAPKSLLEIALAVGIFCFLLAERSDADLYGDRHKPRRQ